MVMRPGPRRAFRTILVLLPLGVTGGCGGSPNPPEMAQTVRSWGATAQFAADRWMHDAVSRRFTALTLERAGSELQRVASKVAQLPDTAEARAPLASNLAALRSAIGALDSAVAHDDRAGAARSGARLARAQAQVDTLAQSLEGGQ